jgi:hypothetical protein
MVARASGLLRFEDAAYFRLSVLRKGGSVTGIEIHYRNGNVESLARSE